MSEMAWLQHPSVCPSESGVYSVGQSCSRFASIPQGCARDGGKETVTQSQPFRRLLRESLQSVFAPLTLTLAVMALACAPFAQAQSEAVIYNFQGAPDGNTPEAGLVSDKSGNLYGTTSIGGQFGQGAVFRLMPPDQPGGAWTESVLYSFQLPGSGDGVDPAASLVVGRNGHLYGTTNLGGQSGLGTVFVLKPPSAVGGIWAEEVLYSFDGVSGAYPEGLTLGGDGSLYGVTASNGLSGGNGTVYRLSERTPGGPWINDVIHYFQGFNDGIAPRCALVVDERGNLFGTTWAGGRSGNGTVFELSPAGMKGGFWEEKTLHDFMGGIDGANPIGGVVFDRHGSLYGTTPYGGQVGTVSGTVFRLSQEQFGRWAERVLYTFTGGSDGTNPYAPLIIDAAGNLYGTTQAGGSSGCQNGCGVVFQLAPPIEDSGSWSESVLHSFSGPGDGANPIGGVVFDKHGSLLGTTLYGGQPGYGIVYALYP
jgi:uncharacterized repeat protein (TIGR03803 family)